MQAALAAIPVSDQVHG